jgi:hypothetical protein
MVAEAAVQQELEKSRSADLLEFQEKIQADLGDQVFLAGHNFLFILLR